MIGVMMPCCLHAAPPAGNATMNTFINNLMIRTTLEEKIGQLNLLSAGFGVTGPEISTDIETKVEHGLAGGVFNVYTPSAVRKLQSLAVNQSRLHIPLLIGFDVIHGHKTIFPMPLALSCTWNPEAVEQSIELPRTRRPPTA